MVKRTSVDTRTRASIIVVATATVLGLGLPFTVPDVSGAASNFSSVTVVVSTTKSAPLGTYLESGGRTLYTLNKTSCPSKCLKYWPPLLLAKGQVKANAGAGVVSSKLGKVRDSAGAWQVTYAGKALYWFAKDTKAKPVSGNQVKDTWGVWAVVVTKKPVHVGTSTTTTTVPSGGGTSF